MNTRFVDHPWGLYGIYAHLLVFEDPDAIPDVVVRSRATHPNCGDGPYFTGVKRVKDVWVNGTHYDLRGVDATIRGLSFSAGNTAEGFATLLSGNMSNPWNLGRATITDIEEVERNSEGVRVRRTVYNNISGSWNYDLNGLKDHFDSLCAKVRREAAVLTVAENFIRWTPCSVEGQGGGFDYSVFSVFCSITELEVFPGHYAQGFSAAYVNAVDSFDLASCNTLANVLEAVSTIKSIVKFIKAPVRTLKSEWRNFLQKGVKGNAEDAWLSYRYVYTTTRLDIKEYKELIARLKGLRALLGTRVSGTGSFSNEYGSFKAKISVLVEDVYPHDITSWLDTVGAAPTAVNIWDMVPYSFIADWFFHIGEIIEYFDRVGNSINLPVSGCWFTFMNSDGDQFNFFRVPGRRLEVLPSYVTKEASTKTITMRVADTIALFF